MRGLGFLLMLVLGAAPSAAQQLNYDLSASPTLVRPDSPARAELAPEPGQETNSVSTTGMEAFDGSPVPRFELEFTGDISAVSSDEVIVKDTIAISGPLVRPFKAHSVLDFPVRLLQLFNPFAKNATGSYERRIEPIEARAWSTIVGWSTGGSAFADDTHHEPHMPLLTVSVAKSQ